MEISNVSNNSMNTNFRTGAGKVEKPESELVARDAFVAGENQGEELPVMPGKPGKTWSLSSGIDKAYGVAEHTMAGLFSVLGGVGGMALGALYDFTIMGPFVGALIYQDDHPGTGYAEAVVKQVAAPVRWAIGGAKKGYTAGLEAMRD